MEISLNGSASFFKESHKVIFPSNFNHVTLLKLSVKLQPLTDEIILELNEVLEEKKNLDVGFIKSR